MKLLLIERDPDLARSIAVHLGQIGFEVDIAASSRRFPATSSLQHYNALIVGLDEEAGGEWTQMRRGMETLHKKMGVPMIMLVSPEQIGRWTLWLDPGHFDYVVRPIELLELEARLRALLEHSRTHTKTLEAGNLVLDPQLWAVTVNEGVVELSRREFVLLELVLLAHPRPVTKQRVETLLYESPPTANAVEAMVSRLRRKLAAANANVQIEAARGLGYRLVLPSTVTVL